MGSSLKSIQSKKLNEPRSSEPSSSKPSSTPSTHLIHSEKLKNLNLGHSFPLEALNQQQRGFFSKFRAKLVSFFLGSYLEAEKEYQTNLVQYLNELTTQIDLNLTDKLLELEQDYGKSLAILRDDLEATNFSSNKEKFDELNKLKSSSEKRFELINNQLNDTKAGLEQVQAISSGLEKIVRKLNSLVEQSNNPKEDSKDIEIPSFDYLIFENRFRGPEELIKNRLKVYLDYFQDAPGKILEVGPGRGEFLELCQENQIDAYGVELDKGMFSYLNDKPGLEVVEGDGIKHLKELENASLGGLIATQVIEHLPYDVLKDFVQLSASKLAPGAKVIFETINPNSIVALTQHYFRDPTHVAPLHPDTMKFIFDVCGIEEIEILELEPFDEAAQMLKVDETSHMTPRWSHTVKQLNQNFDKLNSLLFGYQDYCIVGTVKKENV